MNACMACRHVGANERCPMCGHDTTALVEGSAVLEPSTGRVRIEEAPPAGWRIAAVFLLPIVGGGVGLVMLARAIRAHPNSVSEEQAAWLAIGVVVAATVVGIAIAALRAVRRASHGPPRMSAVACEPAPDAGETTIGVARRLDAELLSFGDGQTCLGTQARLMRGDRIVAWRAELAEHVVERDDGERVVIAGAARLELPPMELGTDRTRAGKRVRGRLGIPSSWIVDARVEVAALTVGMRVAVSGRVDAERHPRFAAGYRDGGEVSVVRGTAGSPVVIRLHDAER